MLTKKHAQNDADKLKMHNVLKQTVSTVGLTYGRQIYRFRWPVLLFWVVAFVVSLPFASRLPTVLIAGGFTADGSEAAQVADVMGQQLHVSPWPLLVLFHAEQASVHDPAYQKQVSDFIQHAASFEHVVGVMPPVPGKDGHTELVVVNMDHQVDAQLVQLLPAFHHLLSIAGPAHGYITGTAVTYQSMAEISQQDVEHAELLVLPLSLLGLLLIFGTLCAALLPLLLTLVVLPVALAIIYGIAMHLQTNILILNIVSCVGIGMVIDACLIIIRRFREELLRQPTVCEAVACTVVTAGRAIFFSCLIVLIGFSALFAVHLSFMNAFGLGGSIVVVITALATLSLLPALLSILGTRIFMGAVPGLSRLTVSTSGTSKHNQDGNKNFWHAWAEMVMRHPLFAVLLVAVLLGALGWPLFSLAISSPSSNELPNTTEVRQGSDLLQANYPAQTMYPIYLVAQTATPAGILEPATLEKLDHLTQWITAQPHVVDTVDLMHLPAPLPHLSVEQLTLLYSTGAYQNYPMLKQFISHTTSSKVTMIAVVTTAPFESSESRAFIERLRTLPTQLTSGLTLLVGGAQAASVDFNARLYESFFRVIAVIVLLTYGLLLIMFRSLILPLKAIAMNVLSVGVTCGILVLVFQWGHLRTFLHFTANGTVDAIVPILLFCILFGLSMDYEVFLLSRIQEEWLKTFDNRQAITVGLEKTAGIITSAAFLFMLVSGAFTLTRVLAAQEIGLGLTVAVFIEATVIRIVLVPATMCLFGAWNWWMPRLFRARAESTHNQSVNGAAMVVLAKTELTRGERIKKG